MAYTIGSHASGRTVRTVEGFCRGVPWSDDSAAERRRVGWRRSLRAPATFRQETFSAKNFGGISDDMRLWGLEKGSKIQSRS
jgi:hypothetical protein